jgi:EmrB/QacA subfamily drug resistance transporter
VTAALVQRMADPRRTQNPWHALWAMMVGFFMILLDATIVAVANPEIMEHLDTDYNGVLWVTSAYLLAYAVPLLLAGRLGDRFGPKNLYLAGLAVFTAASLWCGLAGSIEWLVTARVVQGIGAALMTPQTLSAITRIFPPQRRGVALSVWGATAGVATLVGPLAGGFLVDGLGWQWIFIVNVPIGIIGLGLAFWFVPVLATEKHGFDVLGVLLSGVGLFLIVFGLQEGQSHDWAWWIWGMVAAGLAFMGGFVYWQAVNRGEPLIPLRIFRDNDFSMSNVGIAVIGFVVTAMVVPVMFYAQTVCGLSPTRSALLMAPMAVASGVLAPFVGKIVDRTHPRPIVGFGFSAVAIAVTWLSVELTPTTPIWRLVLPLILMGVGMAFIWSPLAATATRNLPPQVAGAGSGVYNTTRQVGGVLGSAGIAAFMTARMAAELPGIPLGASSTAGTAAELPAFLKEPFAAALSQSLLLPAFVALFGVVSAVFLGGLGAGSYRPVPRDVVGEGPDELEAPTAVLRTRDGAFLAAGAGDIGREYFSEPRDLEFQHGADVEYFPDDDEYVEYTVEWEDDEPESEPIAVVEAFPADDDFPADDGVTAPMHVHVEHPLHAPAETWHSGPVESWHSLLEDEPEPQLDPVAPRQVAATNGRDPFRSLDDLIGPPPPVPAASPEPEPIGFAHNGFHVEAEEHYRGAQPPPAPEPSAGGRHSRSDDDADTYGRHSMRFRD